MLAQGKRSGDAAERRPGFGGKSFFRKPQRGGIKTASWNGSIYFAPLGLGGIEGAIQPRPTLRLAWADIGCPFGAKAAASLGKSSGKRWAKAAASLGESSGKRWAKAAGQGKFNPWASAK